MPAMLRRRVAAARSALLTLGAVAGAICLLATLVAPVAGVRPLIFLSGSMSPTIPAGSLALARTVDAADIEVGDIVTVPSNGSFVTHRVVEVTHAPGRATMMLRGDGNKVDDAGAYDVASAPRTEIWIPGAGRVVTWFSQAPGVYVLAAWVALVLSTLRRHRSDASQGGPGRSRPGRPKLALILRRRLAAARTQELGQGPRLARAVTGVAVATVAPVAVPAPTAPSWAGSVGAAGTSLGTAPLVTGSATAA